jgi:hypothetical protein
MAVTPEPMMALPSVSGIEFGVGHDPTDGHSCDESAQVGEVCHLQAACFAGDISCEAKN